MNFIGRSCGLRSRGSRAWRRGGEAPKPARRARTGSPALAVSAVALEHLDLVAVGILDEEEARQRAAVVAELADRVGGEAGGGEAGVLGVEVADGEGEVAVAVAEGIGRGAALVDGELDLEVGLGVAR